ncbi:aidA [Scenedesmus sp. PABB004]|nr:aidA [Scenedesmus sp. PABB004]
MPILTPDSATAGLPAAPAARKPAAARALLPRWGARLGAAAAALALLVACPWERLDTSFDWDRTPLPEAGAQETAGWIRRVLTIQSRGEALECWLYTPKHTPGGAAAAGCGAARRGAARRGAARRGAVPPPPLPLVTAPLRGPAAARPPPVLIMGHGMGAQKDIGLWKYAEKFVAEGMAVLVFDYRGFGGSGGLPRHWVSPRRHLEDWDAVVSHVQATGLGGAVDASRVALWGVSYGGGHVIVTAAKFGRTIGAVIANEPYVSPEAVRASVRMRGLARSLRLLAVGVADALRGLLGERLGLPGLPPIYLRLFAPLSDPAALSLLQLQDSEMAIRGENAPPRRQGGWQNKVLARVVLEALGYDPSARLGAVTAPLFFRVASKDHLCPPAVLRAALARAGLPGGQVVVQERDVTHLEAHAEGVRPEELAPAAAFLRRHLGLAERAPGDAAPAGGGGNDGGDAEAQFPLTE